MTVSMADHFSAMAAYDALEPAARGRILVAVLDAMQWRGVDWNVSHFYVRIDAEMKTTGVPRPSPILLFVPTCHLLRHMEGGKPRGKPAVWPPYTYAADDVVELPKGQSYYGHRFVATVQGVVGCGPTPDDAAITATPTTEAPHA